MSLLWRLPRAIRHTAGAADMVRKARQSGEERTEIA